MVWRSWRWSTLLTILVLLGSGIMRNTRCQLTFQPKNHWTMQALTSRPSSSFPPSPSLTSLLSRSASHAGDMTLDQFVDKTMGILALISLAMKDRRQPPPPMSSSPERVTTHSDALHPYIPDEHEDDEEEEEDGDRDRGEAVARALIKERIRRPRIERRGIIHE